MARAAHPDGPSQAAERWAHRLAKLPWRVALSLEIRTGGGTEKHGAFWQFSYR